MARSNAGTPTSLVTTAGQRRAGVPRGLLLPSLVLVTWFLVSASGGVRRVFLPSPMDVASALGRSLTNGSLLIDVWASCFRIITGFLIAFFVAIVLGSAMGSSTRHRQYVEPLNDFLRYIPVPAMVPLLILWLGISDRCQIAVIVFGTLPQLLVMVVDALTRIPQTYLDICRTLNLGKWGALRYAYVPFASPQIYDAARVCVGWAWSYLVVAEIIGASRGLGQHIIVAQRFVRTDQVMAGIVVIAVLGLGTDLLFRRLFPVLFPWAESTRHRWQ